MNSKVHGVIVRAIKNVIDPTVLEILYSGIDQDAWKKVRDDLQLDKNNETPEVYDRAKSYFDILCLGAVDEDNTKLLSDVEDPNAKACAMGQILVSQSGEHQHWLEHFWNDSLSDDRNGGSKQGFSINHKYIADVVSEITGVNYLQTFGNLGGLKLGSMSNEAVTALVEAAIALWYGDNLYDSYYSAPNRANRYWKKALEQYQKEEYERAFYNLGKVCHLLADVGTPAHVHNDGHMGVNWLETFLKKIGIDTDCPDFFKVDDDKYEVTTGKAIEEKLESLPKEFDRYDEALPHNWRLTDKGYVYYDPSWNLYDYFKSLGQLTRKYDSDDADGVSRNKPFHWEHFDLLNFDSFTHALERCANDDLTEYACNAIAQDLIPLSIAHTAGILYLFFNSVKAVVTCPQTYKVAAKKIHIHNDEDDCQAGEIYFTLNANEHYRYLPKISAKSGDVKNLTGTLSCEVTTPATSKGQIEIHTEAEDNDDWTVLGITVHKAKDSLGETNDIIEVSEVDKSKQPVEFSKRSSNKDYTIYISVRKGEKEKKTHDIKKILKKIDAKKLEKLLASKYKEGSTFAMQPLLMNLDSHHFHCNTLANKDCMTWRNVSGRKIKAYVYDSEISKFRKISPKNSMKVLQGLMKHVNNILAQGANKQKFINQLNSRLSSSTKITEQDIKDYTKEVLKTIDTPKFKECIDIEEQKKNILSCLPGLSDENKEYLSEVTSKNFYDKFKTSCSCCQDKKTQKYLQLRKSMIK